MPGTQNVIAGCGYSRNRRARLCVSVGTRRWWPGSVLHYRIYHHVPKHYIILCTTRSISGRCGSALTRITDRFIIRVRIWTTYLSISIILHIVTVPHRCILSPGSVYQYEHQYGQYITPTTPETTTCSCCNARRGDPLHRHYYLSYYYVMLLPVASK